MRCQRIVLLVLLSPLLLTTSCVLTRTVRPEYLYADSTKDVLVTTRDGRQIRMFAGNYNVVRYSDTSALEGTGQLLINSHADKAHPFRGKVFFSEVDSIEVREKTIAYYALPAVLAGSAIALLYIVIIMIGVSHRGLD
jgi:hypothetical protein